MNVNDMTKEEILKWTNKSGAYELGRQQGYSYGFVTGSKAGARSKDETIEKLSSAISNAQKILAHWIVPDSKITDDECLSELLDVLDNVALINLQEKVKSPSGNTNK